MTFKSMTPVALALVLSACQSTGMPDSKAEQTQHVSQPVYVLEYQSAERFKTEADQLAQAFGRYCEQADLDTDTLKTQWHQTMTAWMALQGQERGPAAALEQSWNVQFWPDKKNTTGRKMAALVHQDRAWSAEQIAQQSVTVQGLGALEWLLYDATSPLTSAPKSALGISQNLANKADVIAQAWQQNPWKAMDVATWESEYIALLSNQLEHAMSKMTRPLANVGKPRPYFSESWRSKTSMLNLKANVEAMQALYLASLDGQLRERNLVELADRVKTQYANLVDTWPAEPSLFDMLQTKEGYRDALSQYNKLDQLKYLLHEEVAVALGVVIGFNSSDGD
ncbi:imelysin family protein [Vibrio furnissii]|uniref:imelysin family protein n=1 Tax=Vibrio furnissii TaxID=29494 RepID=UPI0001B91F4B|nr:imelysin family protein [Vibrio furnissii]EEX41505.1 iron-regulated protein A precursor [Vibrio furnissii CIP 102972]QDC93235.1 iron-regulated protein A [Vibrio furnissii]UON48140.1 iron-regulated protein A [Vibrio furnissii]SUP45660.1 iron-regulated protein A [Vibrio furnissii]